MAPQQEVDQQAGPATPASSDPLRNGRTTTNQEGEENTVSYAEIAYAMDSFHAIVQPVFLTMVLTAVSVVYISTPESQEQGEESLSNSYIVLDGDDEDSNTEKLGQSLVNGFILVLAIGVITFLVVLLYKYRCMKCLLGYLIFASTMLLGYLSSEMFRVAIDRYDLRIDKLSFALTMFNFAIVGTLAIFFGKGMPRKVSQAYLMASAVIVAWHLSHFDPWTAWVVLVLLALYDLFAVLSPCGPLKLLVNLMQKEDAPEMPGLLYEASLPGRTDQTNGDVDNASTTGNTLPQGSTASAAAERSQQTLTEGNGRAELKQHGMSAASQQGGRRADVEVNLAVEEKNKEEGLETAENGGKVDEEIEREVQFKLNEEGIEVNTQDMMEAVAASEDNYLHRRGQLPLALALAYRITFQRPNRHAAAVEQDVNEDDIWCPDSWSPEELQQLVNVIFPRNNWCIALHKIQRPYEETRYAILDPNQNVNKVVFVNEKGRVFEDLSHRSQVTGIVPLALAKLNKLALVHGPQPSWVRRPEIDGSDPTPTPEEWTPEQLNEEVEVIFPRNGWRVVPHSQQNENEEKRYDMVRPDGTVKRIVFVNQEGLVFEDLREKNRAASEREKRLERNSIKLGLGDFIFYSILVAKAALYSFTSFVACTVAIIVGLALTLLMLAFRGKALPALPISIFLGVSFYFLARYIMQPWVTEVFILKTYV